MEPIDKSLEKIATACVGDRIPVIWGVCSAFSDEKKLKYSGKYLYTCWYVLTVDVNKNRKYTFCSDMFYSGHDLIRKCAREFGYCKWRMLFGLRLSFTYNQLWFVLNKTAAYLNEYEGTGHTYKKCFYSKEEAEAYRDKLNEPLIREDKEKHLAQIKIEMPELIEKSEENTKENSSQNKLFRKKRI